MAGRAISELMAPEVILREVSQLQLPGTVISDIFGWGLSARNPDAMGGNMINYDLREGSFDVFNRTRSLATGRVPGTSASRQKPQRAGRVRFALPRVAETMPLTDEELVNRRAIGQPVTAVDSMGENFIMRQKEYLAMRVANVIEFQAAALLRGSYSYDQVGDDLRHGFSGGETTIDWQIPANNKNQLNGIIAASWATVTTDIPAHVAAVNRQCNTNSGLGIGHALLGSDTWQYLVNNDKIKAQAGTSNTPYSSYRQLGPGHFSIELRAIPWVQWHIIDYTLEVWDGSAFTDTRLVQLDQVTMIPEASPNWTQYLNGGEVVTEGPNGPRSFRNGFYAFGYPSWDPSGWMLNIVFNGIPALYNPNVIFNADVTP